LSPDPKWTAAVKGLYEIYKPLGLEIVGINSYNSDVRQTEQYIQELRIPWPVALDAAAEGSFPGRTDAEGRFEFDNLMTGAYTFDITHDGFEPVALERVPAGTTDAVVELRPKR
jgi:hypothetical protein